MGKYRTKIGILIIIFFTSNWLLAKEVIPVYNDSGRIEAMDPQIYVLEDATGILSFSEILKQHFDISPIITTNNRDRNTAYWLKFDFLAGEDLTRNKIIEILDFKIDSFELYLPDAEMPGKYTSYKGGDAYPFGKRQYRHKNFVFDFPHYKKGNYTGYMRFKATEVVGLNFAISNISTFLQYSNNEYLILSIFYGVVAAMVLLSLFMYVYLREKSYLFYALYILSLGLYFLTRDGLGFEYLWPGHPQLNVYCRPVSVFLVVFFHVFFVKYYLKLDRHSTSFNNVMYALLAAFPIFAYVLDHFLGIIPDPLIAASLVFVPLMVFAIRLALQGDIQARFFVIAYLVQFLGFLIFILAFTDLIGKGMLNFYSINIASAVEIIIFSLALAGKVKQLIREKEEIKDQANHLLEQKVEERTRELKERNNQLDIFVYKASHDIKGPLKSMIGLTNLALTDVEDPVAKEYFEYMRATSARLDYMVSELLRMGKVKDLEVNYSDVTIHKVIAEIISSLKHLPGFERITVGLNISQEFIIKTDETLLYSVFQNIIENAIKYMDYEKTSPFLTIRLEENSATGMVHVYFEDNGLGIPEDRMERIFEMFYKVNDSSSGTGLGLYLTKLTVERLNGKLDLRSEEGKGTTFIITLPA